MPETHNLPLNADGKCTLCSSPGLLRHIVKEPDPEGLKRRIEKVRRTGKSRQFDCIVGWSGGRDSTYLLHELIRTHGLRCAAVFVRTPFTPEEISENVRSISGTLGIHLITVETPANHVAIARFCLQEYMRTKQPILINLACAACKFVNREIFREARRLGIKTAIYGSNRFEYIPAGPASIDIDSENRHSFPVMVRDAVERIRRGAGYLLQSPALYRYLPTMFQASVLYVNQYTMYLRVRYPDIDRFDYYYLADWNEDQIHSTLKDLGWKLPAGCTTTWRADCIFDAVKNVLFERSVGFTYSQAMYSNLIRSRKMTRTRALERLKKETVTETRLHQALKLCRIEPAEFNESNNTGRDRGRGQEEQA